MKTCVVDASIAVKWVVDEADTPAALRLRAEHRLIAPDLLVPECANILWKKVRRGEMEAHAALLAARLLESADIELLASRPLLEAIARLAIELDHPAYDCLYLAMAVENACPFVTADESFVRKMHQRRHSPYSEAVVSLAEALGRGADSVH